MFKSKLIVGVAVFTMGLVSLGVNAADSEVMGQLKADRSLVLNPDTFNVRVNNETTLYVKGDVVSTVGHSSAKLMLSSGSATVVIAPDSIVSIQQESPLIVEVQQGGVSIVSSVVADVELVTPKGNYVLNSDSPISAVAVFQDGELAVMPSEGDILVEAGQSVAKVAPGTAFIVEASGPARVVEVLAGSNGILIALLAAAAIIAGIIIAADDDDEPASPAR